MNRYIVSKNLPPKERREGYVAEIVDTTHPSDGGPVAIDWFRTEAEAIARAEVLNESESERRYELRNA